MGNIIDIIQKAAHDIQVGKLPSFEVGTWEELNEVLSSMNLSYETQREKFPLIFLLTDITGTGLEFDNNLLTGYPNVYIFGAAADNKRTLWRHENEFPELRTIRDSFLQALINNGATFESVKPFDDLFYNSMLLNKLDMKVNCIQLGFNNFQVETEICEI